MSRDRAVCLRYHPAMPILVAYLIRFGLPLALVAAGVALIRRGGGERRLGIVVAVIGGTVFLLLVAVTIWFLSSTDLS
jgi:hypothetical protein